VAKTLGASIVVVHVLRSHDPRGGLQATDPLSWEVARLQARTHLDRLRVVISAALGEPVETRLEQGRPADRILDVARELSADLIVLGSGGSDASDGILGRTAQRILARARASVLIGPPSSAPATLPPHRILVPLDGSLRAESALPTAVRLAKSQAAELLLVHVVQEPHAAAMLEAAGSREQARELASSLEAGAERYLERIKERLERDGVVATARVVRHANERQCLLEVAQSVRADLVLLSAHGSSCDAGRTFGGVTGQLLSYSAIPVLVLQDLVGDDLQPGRERLADGGSVPPPPRVAQVSARA
jgi:nucleotide-binding universal stress UspA family protein